MNIKQEYKGKTLTDPHKGVEIEICEKNAKRLKVLGYEFVFEPKPIKEPTKVAENDTPRESKRKPNSSNSKRATNS